jgi:hypothetical protein
MAICQHTSSYTYFFPNYYTWFNVKFNSCMLTTDSISPSYLNFKCDYFYVLLYKHLTIQQHPFHTQQHNTLQRLGFRQSRVNFKHQQSYYCAKIIPESGNNLTNFSTDQTDQTTYATFEMGYSALYCGIKVPRFQSNQLPPSSVKMTGCSWLL